MRAHGIFENLEEIVHFSATREVEAWPPREVPEDVHTDELGNLGLTVDEEVAISSIRTV